MKTYKHYPKKELEAVDKSLLQEVEITTKKTEFNEKFEKLDENDEDEARKLLKEYMGEEEFDTFSKNKDFFYHVVELDKKVKKNWAFKYTQSGSLIIYKFTQNHGNLVYKACKPSNIRIEFESLKERYSSKSEHWEGFRRFCFKKKN